MPLSLRISTQTWARPVVLVGLAVLLTFGLRGSASAVATADPSAADPADAARSAFQALLVTQQPPASSAVTGLPTLGVVTNGVPFPHEILYGGSNSSGWPFVGTEDDTRPSPTAPFNDSVLDDYARFPFIIIPPMPISDVRPEILAEMRRRNTAQKIFAYEMGYTTWCPSLGDGNIAYPAGSYYRDYWIAANGSASCTPSNDSMLWLQNGHLASDPLYDIGFNVNIAHAVTNPDSSVRYDVAERVAEAMYEHGKQGRGFDGIFIDVFCYSMDWVQHDDTDPTPFDNSIWFDYKKAGYGTDNTNPANRTAFDLGWRAGHQRLIEHLRELAIADGNPDFPITGNCGQSGTQFHPYLNGWMRENFPFQNGGTWYSNMLTWPWGFIHQDHNFRNPQYNFIFTASVASGGTNTNPIYDPYNVTNQHKMRFGLGSAAMGNGFSAFHDGSANPQFGLWYKWWYDEYAVDVTVANGHFGQAVKSKEFNGWLGQALTPSYQQLSQAYDTTTQRITNNTGFETAGANPSTIPNWNFNAFAPAAATFTRDTTTAGEGTASLKVDVTSSDPTYSYVVQARSNDTFTVNANQQYSVTFKAKASADLPLTVVFANGPGGAGQTLQVDTTWRQYQAVLTATNFTVNAIVRFEFGLATGTYWVDDVHVQSAVTSVWRRDFEHGTVLLNPADATQTVTLDRPMRRILGTVNPTLNDGSVVTTVNLPGAGGSGIGDAAFLIAIDDTPPGRVIDLRPGS